MEREGVISDTEHLTLYGFKDTGITNHIETTSPLATMDQAGHSDLRETLRYRHSPVIIAEYRDLPDNLNLLPK